MTATVGSIQVIFDAQYGPAVQSLRKFASEGERTGKTVVGSVARIDKAAKATNASLARLNGSQFRTLTLSALRASNSVERLRGILLSTSSLLGGFSAAFAIRGLQEYSDTYRSLTNQIKVSIGEGQDLAKTQEDIFQTAQRSRAEYEATAKLFSRINTSAKKLQIAQKDSLRVTETIQKAFVLGGSTPTEAAQSSLQLSQGIASNKLGGDELRSVLENPALGQLLADQISDGDIGKLRQLSEEGKLTAGVVIRAFLGASKQIDEMFNNTEQTVGQAFQRIDNALLKYVGTNQTVQSSMSATVTLANALADNIDTVATAIIYLGAAAAGVFGANKLRQLSAYVAGIRAMRAEAILAANAAKSAALVGVQKAETGLVNAGLGLLAVKQDGTPKQIESATKSLAAAQGVYAAATKDAAVKTAQLNSALAAQKAVATATGVAMRGLGAAMSFLGGPIGLALIAISGYLAYNEYQAQQTEEAVNSYAEAIKNAGEKSKNSTPALLEAARALEEVKRAAQGGTLEKNTALQDQNEKLASVYDGIFRKIGSENFRNIFSDMGTKQALDEVNDLAVGFRDGKTSLEQLESAFRDISGKQPDLSKALTEILNLARSAVIARGAIASIMGGTAETLPTVATTKGARPDMADAIRANKVTPYPEDIKKSTADQLAEGTIKRLQEQFENGKLDPLTSRMFGFDVSSIKSGGSKPDPFGDAMKSTATDTAELKAQLQVLKQFNPLLKDYGREAAAAKEGQELLTAAQKGGQAVGKELTDVQQLLYGDLTKLTPAARQQALAIRELALANGEATAEVNKQTEANQKATENMEFQKDLLKSSLSTFREALIEGKSLWQALGDVALNVLDKIADKLETQFVDALFNAFGNSSSQPGGFNIFSLLIGGANAGVNAGGATGGGVSGAMGKVTGAEIDTLAARTVGLNTSVATNAAQEAGALAKGGPQEVVVRSYFDDNGNFKSEVVRLSAATAAPMLEEGQKQAVNASLPRAIDRHNQRPRRQRVSAV